MRTFPLPLVALLLLCLPTVTKAAGLRRLRKDTIFIPDLTTTTTTTTTSGAAAAAAATKTTNELYTSVAGFATPHQNPKHEPQQHEEHFQKPIVQRRSATMTPKDHQVELLLDNELEDLFLYGTFFRQLQGSMSFSMSMDTGSGEFGGGGGGGDNGGDNGNGDKEPTDGDDGDNGNEADKETTDGEDGDTGDDEPTNGDNSNGAPTGSNNDDGSAVFEKCGISEQDRSSMLLDMLSLTSSMLALTDTSAPQYQARMWLEKDDGAQLCPNQVEEARIIQRYIVGLIYYAFGGNNWTNCRAQGAGSCFQEDSTSIPAIPFLDASHECLWFGLTCTDVPREALPSQRDIVSVDTFSPITSVDISDNALSGDLFAELFYLTKLQELTLDGNKGISGSIPEEIGLLTDLIAVDIDDNKLSGSLPASLYQLTNLEAIDLNSNALTGTISNDIGNLQKLVVVQFDDNELTGFMPSDGILSLEGLAVWTALDNDLTGSVEQVCAVVEQRRIDNDFPGYLQFFWVDCKGNPPPVECSCCECEEPENPTSF